MKITVAEILDELARAAKPTGPDDAFTMGELRAVTGWGEKQARERLHALKAAGALECVRVMRQNIIGQIVPTPAYRLIKAAP